MEVKDTSGQYGKTETKAVKTKVPKGYKLTEVGVIPEDWKFIELRELCDIRDGTHESPKYFDNGVKFITSKNIVNGQIDLNDISYISKEDAEKINQRSKVEYGDILMSMIGTVGNAALVNSPPDFCIKNVALIKPKKVKKEYLFQVINSDNYINYIEKKLDGGIQKFIALGAIRALEFPLPPTLAEQTSIATVLSDTDALIASLEKLIAKKRNIKQGAMQELLASTSSAQVRPKEGWVERRLGEVGVFITKGTTPTSIGRNFKDKGINFIKIESIDTNGDIINEKLAYIDNQTNNVLKRSQLQEGDILFSIAGALGKLTIISKRDLPANTNQALAIIRLTNSPILKLNYLYHFLKNPKIQDQINIMSVQAAQANLSLQNISDFVINYPNDCTEQTRIATILSDMDAEIQGLEAKLTKYRDIKQGMMQDLLTGRVRLV